MEQTNNEPTEQRHDEQRDWQHDRQPNRQPSVHRSALPERVDADPNYPTHDTLDAAFDAAQTGKVYRGSGDSKSGVESETNAAETPNLPSGYEYRGLIGRGGMGTVYLVHELDLERDVALKVLRRDQSTSTLWAVRFVEEAKISGQLQHPGIVPIYDFGFLPDGDPYLTMKWIQGRTLSEILASATMPQDQERLLEIFGSVCQTVAFAHSKRIIHRDLKPSNIMVGAYGEVQVMDWGLAKALGQSDLPADPTAPPQPNEAAIADDDPGLTVLETADPLGGSQLAARPSFSLTRTGSLTRSSSLTRTGSVIGTLAYMPPEQAQGRIEDLGTQVDVFALGSILARILTGVPPYDVTKRADLQAMAVAGDLHACHQRIEACGCDDELKQIVQDALSVEPADRPADAAILAERFQAYQNRISERLRSTELEQAAAEARAEEAVRTATAERHRRRVISAMFGLIAFGSLLATLAVWQFQRNRDALREAEVKAGQVAQREANEAADRERQWTSRIERELASGEAALSSADETKPTKLQLSRAKVAIDGTAELLNRVSRKSTVHSRWQRLSENHERLLRVMDLLQQLDHIQLDAANDFSDEATVVRSNPKTQARTVGARIAIAPSIAAFRDAGLRFGNDIEHDLEQVLGLPDWARTRAEIHLMLLQRQMQHTSKSSRFDQSDWQTLKADKHRSKGGATMTELADGSIEASGTNPLCDVYQFEFAMPTHALSMLRLEVLPSTLGTGEANDARGPLGRGKGGNAAMTNFVVEVINADGKVTPLKVQESEASYCFDQQPLQATSWNLTFVPRKPQWAIFSFDQPYRPTKNTGQERLRVTVHHQTDQQYGDQNLARVRLSYPSDAAGDLPDQAITTLTNRLLEIESDPWANRLWQAVDDPKIESLLGLLNDPAIKTQPIDRVIVLSELVELVGSEGTVEASVANNEWITAKPRLPSFTKMKWLPDDWIEIVPGNVYNCPVDWRGIFREGQFPTGIRFDVHRDELDEDRDTIISEILVEGRWPTYGGVYSFPVTDIFSNHHRVLEAPISSAFDDNINSRWKVVHPKDKPFFTSIIKLGWERFAAVDDSFRFELQSPRGELLPRKFRVYWTFDELDWSALRDACHKALQDAYIREPANARLLMAMSRNVMANSVRTPGEALGYATAAISLRPDDPVTLDKYTRLAMLQNPSKESDLYRRVFALSRRQQQTSGDASGLNQLRLTMLQQGQSSFRKRDYKVAANFFERAQEIAPDKFTEWRRLGVCYERTDAARAKEYFTRAIDIADDRYQAIMGLARLARQESDFDACQRWCNILIEEELAKSATYFELAQSYGMQRRWDKCIDAYESYLATGGDRMTGVLAVSLTLSDLGQHDQALKRQLSGVTIEERKDPVYLGTRLFLTLESMGRDAAESFLDDTIQLTERAENLPAFLRNVLVSWPGGMHWTQLQEFSSEPRRKVYHRLFRMENLITISEMVADRFPHNSEAMYVRSMAYLENEQYEEALDSLIQLKATVKLDQRRSLFLSVVNAVSAACLHRLGRTDEALPYFHEFNSGSDTTGRGIHYKYLNLIHTHPAIIELKELAAQ